MILWQRVKTFHGTHLSKSVTSGSPPCLWLSSPFHWWTIVFWLGICCIIDAWIARNNSRPQRSMKASSLLLSFRRRELAGDRTTMNSRGGTFWDFKITRRSPRFVAAELVVVLCTVRLDVTDLPCRVASLALRVQAYPEERLLRYHLVS